MINRDGVSLVIEPGMVLQQVLVKVQKGRKLVFWKIIYQTWLEARYSLSYVKSEELFYHLLACELAVDSLGYQWFSFFLTTATLYCFNFLKHRCPASRFMCTAISLS